MVYRIYVEKKVGLRGEADSLLSDIRGFLNIKSVTGVRIVNRYDAENITAELFEKRVPTFDGTASQHQKINCNTYTIAYSNG